MAEKRNFIVSVCDAAFYYDDKLAFTGTSNLNSSIEVTMDEQEVNGGKGNKLIYSFKYNRQLTATVEAADWKLEYIAANVGTKITQQLEDIYHIDECNNVVEGVVTLKDTPVADVAVELSTGAIVIIPLEEVTGNAISLEPFGITKGIVNCTYMYKAVAKKVVIDAGSAPLVGKLVLSSDKHDSKKGKVGDVQIVIPSYALDGNFTLDFSADGVSSTSISGKALAVRGDTCSDGSDVYAYITETDESEEAIAITDIVIDSPQTIMKVGAKQTLRVVGFKSVLIETAAIEGVSFSSGTTATATVGASTGEVTAVKAGTTEITASYTTTDGHTYTDTVKITVQA